MRPVEERVEIVYLCVYTEIVKKKKISLANNSSSDVTSTITYNYRNYYDVNRRYEISVGRAHDGPPETSGKPSRSRVEFARAIFFYFFFFILA